jgi:hypothetical protein
VGIVVVVVGVVPLAVPILPAGVRWVLAASRACFFSLQEQQGPQWGEVVAEPRGGKDKDRRLCVCCCCCCCSWCGCVCFWCGCW